MCISRTIFAVAIGIVSVALPASAGPVTWTLSDVTLAGGGSISGSFTFDADTNIYSDIDIVTSGVTDIDTGDNLFAYIDYPEVWPETSYVLFAFTTASQPTAATQPLVSFQFVSPLTDAGGTISISTTSFFTSGVGTCTQVAPPVPGDTCNLVNSTPSDRVSIGAVVANSTSSSPEPSTLALMGTGMVLCGFRKIRVTRDFSK
jgi:hypothetical protein